MNVNREEFIRKLESIQPGLAARENIEQATHFAQSVLRGDSDRRAMITQSLKQMVGEFIPGR